MDSFLAYSYLIWPTWIVGLLPVLHKELLLSVSLATRTKTARLLTGFVKYLRLFEAACVVYTKKNVRK